MVALSANDMSLLITPGMSKIVSWPSDGLIMVELVSSYVFR